MRDETHGEHTPLLTPKHPENETPFLERLVISVHLSGTGTRQVLLQLDSGGDVPVIYEKTKLPLLERAMLLESSISKARVPFAAFEPQVYADRHPHAEPHLIPDTSERCEGHAGTGRRRFIANCDLPTDLHLPCRSLCDFRSAIRDFPLC
jgi:hypothetical protein